jgi:arsenate reductase
MAAGDGTAPLTGYNSARSEPHPCDSPTSSPPPAKSPRPVPLGKTFKGLTDEMLEWQTNKLQGLALATDGWTVHVRPELVGEVAFNDVQDSPQYPGGRALRFARVQRYREDKPASEAEPSRRAGSWQRRRDTHLLESPENSPTGTAMTPPLSAQDSRDPRDHRAVRPRVLFLCTHNSARSQMAEGLLRHLGEGRLEAASAGTEVTRVHPLAIRQMERMGIDISGQRSKHLDELTAETFDYVVTVCDRAGETCPIFPGGPVRIHWSIPDPSAAPGGEEEKARAFASAATELHTRILHLLTRIERQEG